MTSTSRPEAVETPDSARSDEGAPWIARRVAWVLLVTALLVVPAVFTVFRYTTAHLVGDGVWQSVMSVQDVDLFYWGQDRFFAILPLLASPIADPTVNLFALLLLNAVSFHALLLTVCHFGLNVIADPPTRRALVIAYVVMVATVHWSFSSLTMYSFALDASPHATAWLLALWSYQLWKRGSMPTRIVAGCLAVVSVGLSPQALMLIAMLALVDAVSSGRWGRWIVFGAIWLGVLLLWTVLARVWGQNGGPVDPGTSVSYFSFSRTALLEGVGPSISTILAAFRPLPVILGGLVAACALLVVRRRWMAMMPRLALAVAFTIAFWAVFTANTWTSMNQYNLRYYFPVAMLPVMAITVPIAAAAAVRVPGPAVVRSLPAVVCAGALLAVLLAGPLRPPSDSIVLRQTQADADYARDNGVLFVSGYYWDMWPILHQTLADGRGAHFVTGPKSGGDPQTYRDALVQAVQAGKTPTAMCVNDETTICTTYLDYWTEPGWTVTDLTCPVPPAEQLLGSPPVQQCRMLEFTGT